MREINKIKGKKRELTDQFEEGDVVWVFHSFENDWYVEIVLEIKKNAVIHTNHKDANNPNVGFKGDKGCSSPHEHVRKELI